MINKVNKPPSLTLVTSGTKSTKNDPGGGSGSGVAYEKDEKPANSKKSKAEPNALANSLDTEEKSELLEKKNISHQIGLARVFELFKSKVSGNKDDLTSRYQSEALNVKGILLNKKAE